MNVVTVAIACIDMGERLRAVDEDYAQLIAASMAVDGQRTPIEIRVADDAQMHRLIAGGHRVRAGQIAGMTHLQAVVLDVDHLDAERLEIEENLCRHELTELDRSTFLARWKRVYEELNEQVRHGKGPKRGKSGQVGHSSEARIERFTTIASERLGLSERVIRRAGWRFNHIAPDVRARIAGSWLAGHGSELDLLARMKPEVQRRVIALMEQRGATALKHLRDEVQGIRSPVPDADKAQFDALVKLWRKTGAKARRLFEAELAKDAQFNLEETR